MLTLEDLSAQWKTWKEQFTSYLIATGLDKAPKEKQLAIFLQRFGTDRPRILPAHTGNNSKTLPWKRPHQFKSQSLKNYTKILLIGC